MSVAWLCILLACQQSERGFGVPQGEQEIPASESSGSASHQDYVEGDPISLSSSAPQSHSHSNFEEWVDVAVLDADTIALGGVTGLAIADRSTGELLTQERNYRVYRVDSHGNRFVTGSRNSDLLVYKWENSALLLSCRIDFPGSVYEAVAIFDSVVAVAAREQGVLLYNVQGSNAQQIARLPASAQSVDLYHNLVVYNDGTEIVVADLDQGELDRFRLPGEGRDIDFDGQTIAVGMGGNGVAVLDWSGEQLSYRGRVELSGAALSVSLDGQHLWVGSWQSVGVISLAAERPIMLGQQRPRSSAMAVAATDGRASVADWYYVTNLELEPRVWSAVAAMPNQVVFGEDNRSTLRIRNEGAVSLSVTFDPPAGFSFSQTEFELEPGQSTRVQVESPATPWSREQMDFTTNDPDRQAESIELRRSNNGIGSQHSDFSLPVVSSLGLDGTARLTDYSGKILFLAWWADY